MVPSPTAFIHCLTASAINSGLVRTDLGRNAPDDEQLRQHIDHVNRVELPLHPDRMALTAELVDDVQRPVGPSIIRPIMDEPSNSLDFGNAPKLMANLREFKKID